MTSDQARGLTLGGKQRQLERWRYQIENGIREAADRGLNTYQLRFANRSPEPQGFELEELASGFREQGFRVDVQYRTCRHWAAIELYW